MDKTKSKRELSACDLEAKAKQLRRQEKAFWAEVEERAEEIKKHLSIEPASDIFGRICQTYGATSDEEKKALYRHIVSDQQVNYYRRSAGKPAVNYSGSPE